MIRGLLSQPNYTDGYYSKPSCLPSGLTGEQPRAESAVSMLSAADEWLVKYCPITVGSIFGATTQSVVPVWAENQRKVDVCFCSEVKQADILTSTWSKMDISKTCGFCKV